MALTTDVADYYDLRAPFLQSSFTFAMTRYDTLQTAMTRHDTLQTAMTRKTVITSKTNLKTC